MKKIFVLAVAILSAVLFSSAVSAHSKLVAAVPAENAVADSPVTEIVLDFNTDIEPVSRITVTNESGEEVAVADIQVSGAQLTGKLAEPLPNGAYTVAWKIIGADGHAVNGSYAFSVNVPELAEPAAAGHSHAEHAGAASPAPSAAEPEPTDDASTQVSAPAPAQDSEAPAGNGTGSASAGSSSNNTVYWIAAAVLVLLVIIFVALRMRKKPS